MARCHKNDVGSLVLNRATAAAAAGHHHHFRLWTSFSSATFRRRLFDAIACGGNSFSRQIDTELQPVNVGEKLPEQNKQRSNPKRTGSDKLSDLLKLTEKDDAKCSVSEESEAAISRKIDALEELKKVVKMLQCEEEEREKGKKVKEAARNVRSLAKENADARTTIAMLGAIPPLVGMIEESCSFDCLIDSLYALLNLGIGNDLNKAAIVKAGAVHKMLKLIESPNGSLDPTIADAIVANFLGLSALDSNKTIIGSSGAIPFLVKILKNLDNTSSSQAKQDSLRALYNLSLSHLNVPFVLETDLIPFLMNTLGDMEVSERILSILSNVVSTPEGRKAISMVPDAFPILVDVLNWTDSPGCQEKTSYIIMVMAHKAYGDRQAMIEAGVVSALLELTLLGSTLAQKRASRILECLRIDKGKQVSESYGGGSGPNLSAPICGSSSSTTGLNQDPKECIEEMEDMMSEEKKAVKQLVQQSLQNNMRRIVKRANLPQDFVPSDHYKSLTSSSTSKSLPF